MGQKVGPALEGVGRPGASSLFALYDAVDKNCHSGAWQDTWEDLSGNSRNATRTTQPATTSGAAGTATPQFTRDGVQFSGVGNCAFTVSRQTVCGANGSNAISVVAMIKSTDSRGGSAGYAGDAVVCLLGDTNGGIVSSFGIHGGKVRCTFYNGGWHLYDSNTSVNDGKWHVVGFTKEAGNPSRLLIYIDGNIDYINPSAYSGSTGWFYDRIGRGYNSGDSFVGHLRNIAIWQELLTPRKMGIIAENIGRFRADGKGEYVRAGVTGSSEDPRKTKGPRFFLEFKYKQIINYAFTACGYKSSAPWKSVHRTVASTDQTTNLGDLMQYAGSYVSGGCSLNILYIWGASNSFAGTTTQTAACNMFTATSYTLTSSMNMMVSRNDSCTVFKEAEFAWISGGGSTSVDKYDYTTETMRTSTFSGGIPGWDGQSGDSGFSDQHYGYWGYSGSTQKITYATDTFASHTQFWHYGQQKGMSSKVRKGYTGNEGSYNGGYNLRRWYFPTDTNIGNVSKPQPNCGEENFTMGQDHQYMLGNYDGVQNNENWKYVYSTDTGTANVAGLSPTAHAGQSSGNCGWRE